MRAVVNDRDLRKDPERD
jgi:hypothetical protein